MAWWNSQTPQRDRAQTPAAPVAEVGLVRGTVVRTVAESEIVEALIEEAMKLTGPSGSDQDATR